MSDSGDYDAILSKYNSSGVLHWTSDISSSYAEYGYVVVVNDDGYIYAFGNTGG